MSKLREKLVDRMIRIYGYEHPRVIAFANACETAPKWQDSILEEIVYFEEKNA